MATKFTFFAEVNRTEVRIVGFENRSTKNEMDALWLDLTVTVQAGGFSGSFKAPFTTGDLNSFSADSQSQSKTSP